ncbi:MAG: helix-turn-helix domain-containing protein [Clostridia bacterium]|nr:helix-turn-helix domain-containing protein [Clostridia bacterium]
MFKNDFGVSIKRYIEDKRMNEIHAQLKMGKKPLELFEEYGFTNYTTLYRSYRKHFGISPSQTSRK